MSSTRVTRLVRASRPAVYAALLDPALVVRWKVPRGMSARVHEWEPREGGAIRVSLTHDASTGTGKTTAQTDTYHGRFVELVPDERVVEVDEFETDHPGLQGPMTVTIALADADGGTLVTGLHEHLPPGLSADDNVVGWESALERLAALVEAPV